MVITCTLSFPVTLVSRAVLVFLDLLFVSLVCVRLSVSLFSYLHLSTSRFLKFRWFPNCYASVSYTFSFPCFLIVTLVSLLLYTFTFHFCRRMLRQFFCTFLNFVIARLLCYLARLQFSLYPVCYVELSCNFSLISLPLRKLTVEEYCSATGETFRAVFRIVFRMP